MEEGTDRHATITIIIATSRGTHRGRHMEAAEVVWLRVRYASRLIQWRAAPGTWEKVAAHREFACAVTIRGAAVTIRCSNAM